MSTLFFNFFVKIVLQSGYRRGGDAIIYSPTALPAVRADKGGAPPSVAALDGEQITASPPLQNTNYFTNVALVIPKSLMSLLP